MLLLLYSVFRKQSESSVASHPQHNSKVVHLYGFCISQMRKQQNIKGEIRYACFAVDVSFDSNLMLDAESNGYTNEIYTFHSIHSSSAFAASSSVSRILYINVHHLCHLQKYHFPLFDLKFE